MTKALSPPSQGLLLVLETIRPFEFNKAMSSGKTKPSLLTCQGDHGQQVEVVAKFSAGCEEGVVNLAVEVIAACLAADLGLPVPKPYLLRVEPSWADSIPDEARKEQVQRSSPVAFGSTHVGSGYRAWGRDERIGGALVAGTLAVFVFDAMVQNVDRRSENPNCLVKGNNIRIIDHEVCFRHGLILGWKGPWEVGSLECLQTPGAHIFRGGLRKVSRSYDRIRAAWAALSDSRLKDYKRAVPVEWADADQRVQDALELVGNVREKIDKCLGEVERVLK